jgi:hypothetical protein
VQINKFLELLIHTGELERLLSPATTTTSSSAGGGGGNSSGGGDGRNSSGGGGGDEDPSEAGTAAGAETGAEIARAVRLLDCGCGSAHLTLGAYHYLANIKGHRVALTGVDSNGALMERSNRCGGPRGPAAGGGPGAARCGGRAAERGPAAAPCPHPLLRTHVPCTPALGLRRATKPTPAFGAPRRLPGAPLHAALRPPSLQVLPGAWAGRRRRLCDLNHPGLHAAAVAGHRAGSACL